MCNMIVMVGWLSVQPSYFYQFFWTHERTRFENLEDISWCTRGKEFLCNLRLTFSYSLRYQSGHAIVEFVYLFFEVMKHTLLFLHEREFSWSYWYHQDLVNYIFPVWWIYMCVVDNKVSLLYIRCFSQWFMCSLGTVSTRWLLGRVLLGQSYRSWLWWCSSYWDLVLNGRINLAHSK